MNTGVRFLTLHRLLACLLGFFLVLMPGTGWIGRGLAGVNCFTLVIAIDPVSSGSVSVSEPPNCSGTMYLEGTTLTLNPVASTGYHFFEWAGTTMGTSQPLVLVMTENESLQARFLQNSQIKTYLPRISNTRGPQPFLNGGFESGSAGWQEFSSHGIPLILPSNQLPLPPHGGSWMAHLGDRVSDTAVLSKTFDIPSGVSTLEFYFAIRSIDSQSTGNDYVTISINDKDLLEEHLCDFTVSPFWMTVLLDMRPYAGDTVTLKIVVTNDVANPSSFFVDDFSLR